MALPFSETWTGSNGSSWPVIWTTSHSGGSAVNDIQSNQGRQLCNTVGGYADWNAALTDIGASDYELRIDIAVGAQEYYSGICFRTDNVHDIINYVDNGFVLETGQGYTELLRIDAGVRTSVSAGVAGSYTSTTVHYRILALGTRIKVKVWTGGTEPGAWTHQIVDSAHTTRTGIALELYGGSFSGAGTAVQFDNLNIITPPVPVFHAAGTAQTNTIGVTVPWPTHVVGDVALLLIESCGGEAATLTTANGFQAVTNSPSSTGTTTNGTRITAFWHRATGSSMASPVVADPGDHVYAVILTFINCIASGNPWDVTAAGVKAAASTALSITGLTTTVANTLVVNTVARDNDNAAAAGSGYVNASLTSLLEVFDAGTISGNGGGLIAVTGEKATAGVVSATTGTVTSSINAYLTIALKPAAGAPTTNAPADTAVSVATAYAPTKSISTNTGTSTAVGVAQQPKASISPSAGNATTSAVAQAPTKSVSPNAGTATSAASAQAPGKSVTATAGVATSSAVANDASVTRVVSPTSGTGSSPAVANAFSVVVSPNADLASSTAVAQSAKTAIDTRTGTAGAVASGLSATGSITSGAGTATAATSASNALPAISPSAGTAQAVGAAYGPSRAVTAHAGTAGVVAEAFEAVFASESETNAMAEEAIAVALALDTAAVISAHNTVAISLAVAYQDRVDINESVNTGVVGGTANSPSVSIAPTTGLANVVATALNAGPSVFAVAGTATSIALAFALGQSISASAQTATSIAIAYDADFNVGEIPKITGRIGVLVRSSNTIPSYINSKNAKAIVESGVVLSGSNSKNTNGSVGNKSTGSKVH